MLGYFGAVFMGSDSCVFVYALLNGKLHVRIDFDCTDHPLILDRSPRPTESSHNCSTRIQQLAQTYRLVEQVYVAVNDGGRQELHVDLDLDRYPATIETASMQIQWHITDDYTFHDHDERETGDTWQCR